MGMTDFFHSLVLAFVPIFVAVDSIGILPTFVSLTETLSPSNRKRVIRQSMITALAVAVGFIFLGDAVFRLLGITADDFKVAGGVLLFIIAMRALLVQEQRPSAALEDLGVVPLGMPLVVGPAVLTTSLIMVARHGLPVTLAAIVLNIIAAGAVFSSSTILMRFLGRSGSKAASKVASILLASIAVMMVRMGLAGIIKGLGQG